MEHSNYQSMTNNGLVPEFSEHEPSRKISSLVKFNMKKSEKSPADKFSYDVKYSSNHYHLVQNRRNGNKKSESMMLLPNRATTSGTRLPRVQMNL